MSNISLNQVTHRISQRFRVCAIRKDGNLLRVELEPAGGIQGDKTFALVNWPGTGSFRNISFAIEGGNPHAVGMGDEFTLELARVT